MQFTSHMNYYRCAFIDWISYYVKSCIYVYSIVYIGSLSHLSSTRDLQMHPAAYVQPLQSPWKRTRE
uniref:Uncharacterized protein n=1 Tax=Anguilla anguilla TaxID=7936 RepID=A0A0E9VHB8_ANGAN